MSLALMLLVLTSIFPSALPQPQTPHICINGGNYSTNTIYSSNLNTALSSISTNITKNGFYNTSFGHGQDTVYAIALCRADLLLPACRSCLQAAAAELQSDCPTQKQAIIWELVCMLHYSNQPLYGILSDMVIFYGMTNQRASNFKQFTDDRAALLDELREKAANGTALLKVGAGSRSTYDSQSIYGMMQCTPDLSKDDCNDCLVEGSQQIYIGGSEGGITLRSSCSIQYDFFPFYNETRLRELRVLIQQTPWSAPAPNNTVTVTNSTRAGEDYVGRRTGKDNKTLIVVVIVAVPIIAVLFLSACVLIYLRKRTKQKGLEIPEVEDISTPESLQHDFQKISDATDGFADTNKLGEGGFGAVYKGTLSNGQAIAVKRLSRELGQGDVEFKNEVLLLARLQHKNLVRLLGFSLHGMERLLIYEFVSNGSLDRFIFDSIKRLCLDWDRRYKIIGGIARGLLYLHEDSRLKIIHRDLKPSNILLDGDMNPKIADFGMARLFGQDETHRNTSRIVGTFGYMSPEYAMHGLFSIKSDVFSFGVLVLEIVSGRKILMKKGVDTQDLLSFAWEQWCQGTPENVIDPMLKDGRGSLHDMVKCIHIGLLCVQENPTNRPTMNSIALMLNSTTITLQVPSHPAFIVSSRYGSGTLETIKADISSDSTGNEMTISVFSPR